MLKCESPLQASCTMNNVFNYVHACEPLNVCVCACVRVCFDEHTTVFFGANWKGLE